MEINTNKRVKRRVVKKTIDDFESDSEDCASDKFIEYKLHRFCKKYSKDYIIPCVLRDYLYKLEKGKIILDMDDDTPIITKIEGKMVVVPPEDPEHKKLYKKMLFGKS